MSRKVLSPDGEEGSRGIIEPKSKQEVHRSRQQEASSSREGQELVDSPARGRREEKAKGADPGGRLHDSKEEPLEDSGGREEVHCIDQGDGRAERANPRASSRARKEKEQLSARGPEWGEAMTTRNRQKQREPGTEGGTRPGYSFRQEQGMDQGARAVPPGPAPTPKQVPPNNPRKGRRETLRGVHRKLEDEKDKEVRLITKLRKRTRI